MRSDVIRIYKIVHSWTGIVAGLALFIAFYAGAITMYEEPLARWISPPSVTAPTALDQADELIALTLAVRPQVRKEFTLNLGEAEDIPARLTWQKDRDDEAPWSSALDPEGGVLFTRLHPSGLAQFVDVLHRTAGIPGELDIGTSVMGVVSALYVLALVSGVIVLLPSLIKDFFALRLGKNLKRMWLDAHNLVGIVSLPFHLAIGLTAVVFGLHDQLYDSLNHMVYQGRLQPIMAASNPFNAIKRDRQPATMLPPVELLARVKAIAPEFQPISLQYRDAGTRGAMVRVWGYDHRHLMRGRGFAVLSPVTGEITNTEYLPGHQGTWSATVAAFFALHFGSYGGGPVRLGYFVLGLAGAFLFYSGNLLWIETRRKKERQNDGPVTQARSTRLMAAGTVGVCLGCVSGISLSIVAGKWLHGLVTDLNAWHQGIYYAVFLGSIAWAFGRGAARAGSDLLWLAAGTTAAIPATSVLAWAVPALGVWTTASPGVDLVALGGALSFVWMARITGRRIKTGPEDSVWSGRQPRLASVS